MTSNETVTATVGSGTLAPVALWDVVMSQTAVVIATGCALDAAAQSVALMHEVGVDAHLCPTTGEVATVTQVEVVSAMSLGDHHLQRRVWVMGERGCGVGGVLTSTAAVISDAAHLVSVDLQVRVELGPGLSMVVPVAVNGDFPVVVVA